MLTSVFLNASCGPRRQTCFWRADVLQPWFSYRNSSFCVHMPAEKQALETSSHPATFDASPSGQTCPRLIPQAMSGQATHLTFRLDTNSSTVQGN